MDDLKAFLDVLRHDPHEPLACFRGGAQILMDLKDEGEIPMQFKNCQIPMTFMGLPLGYDKDLKPNELVGYSEWGTRVLTIICGGMNE